MVEMGPNAANMNFLNDHKREVTLAEYVLQFIFLGYDGFRFPFAYYPTKGANAPEMYFLLWDAILKLKQYGFIVDFLIMDGASNNRALQYMHFKSAISNKFTIINPYSQCNTVSLTMDFSHNIKKWRNNILSSGDKDFCTSFT